MSDKEKFNAGMVQIKVGLIDGEAQTRWVSVSGPDLSKSIRANLAWNETLVAYDTGQR